MVVVAIMGVLALIGVRMLVKHVSSSKSIEALTMVQSIRSGQERYRALHSVYLDVSQSGTWYPQDPTLPANRLKKRTFFMAPADVSHGDNADWHTLNPTVPGDVFFGYQTNAGLPGAPMTTTARPVPGLAWPVPNEPWYVVQALSDTDGDGTPGFFVASSISGEVYRNNEGE
jgi:type II secretory pathway pseudopilin PulG